MFKRNTTDISLALQKIHSYIRCDDLEAEMSTAVDDQPLPFPKKGSRAAATPRWFEKKGTAPRLKKYLPRRCRDGIQKNVLISEPVTGLN
jgi:hypothetical protein